MKKIFLFSLMSFILLSSQNLNADTTTQSSTPTQALQSTINQLIAIAKDNSLDQTAQKRELKIVINNDVNFDALSRRVVVKPWIKASTEEKEQFKALFSNIVVNTYFSLLENYSDEEVSYVKEQLKRTKYAIVDTVILAEGKKIPVRYRLIMTSDNWKIYDFSPEGISLISTYKKNYAPILRKHGLSGLIAELESKAKAKTQD